VDKGAGARGHDGGDADLEKNTRSVTRFGNHRRNLLDSQPHITGQFLCIFIGIEQVSDFDNGIDDGLGIPGINRVNRDVK